MGLTAEDVPGLAAAPDRKGVSTVDTMGIVTRVVQEQQKKISALKAQRTEVAALKAELARIRALLADP